MAINSTLKLGTVVLAMALLTACKSSDIPTSLADIDVSSAQKTNNKIFIKPKTDDEIRSAYTQYLKNTNNNDNSRLDALSRLAELEFNYTDKLLQQQEKLSPEEKDNFDDKLYNSRLDKTIRLLSTSIKDYPNSKNNDTTLYQLAKAYDQRGNHQESIDVLSQLAEKYPKSPFYVEAQFRIAEDAFSYKDYSTAEYSYTEVIIAKNNNIFYEKSLFKRGWARFKQQYYTDAIDDFLEAILKHNFIEFGKLNKSDQEQFNEYFRAVGLAFSYLDGPKSLYDYFKEHPNFIYTYHTYSTVAEIYLKQERYTDAVNTYQQFIKYNPKSEDIPYSHLKIIEIWKNSGFTKKVYGAIESYYLQYNPSSEYWKKQNENSSINRAIRRSLKKYIVLMSGYFHNKYQKTKNKNTYTNAIKWYKRYLKDYSAYAQKDNIYFLYAELLAQKNKNKEALKYFELAAYDNELIIHKKSAYASILISDKLISKNNKTYLKKHISYALKYAQNYIKDKNTKNIIFHAAELAFKSSDYKSTIELADIFINNNRNSNNNYISSLKAESYFNLQEYVESESLFTGLIQKGKTNINERSKYLNKLALSIYRQGEAAQKTNKTHLAINNFSRISTTVAAGSKIAALGLYDAIALNIKYKQWKDAIKEIKLFKKLYPHNKLQTNVSKKLSLAYLNSNQDIKAAEEFEKISSMRGNDLAIKSAALWQAAKLYEEKNKLISAARSYEKYVKIYKKPFPQYMEAMNKLTKIYTKQHLMAKVQKWQKSIIYTDKSALNNVKTERTKYINSFANLSLARSEKSRFNRIKLSLPLKISLRKKKSAMQSSVKFYGNASKYKIYGPTTEATFSIALIYKDFSISLLKSDRPKNLNTEELDQYEILLEDQAFPFEDKSIEFFEINLSRIKGGHYNKWIKKSHEQLIKLFPTRYKRQPKVDNYISVLH